MDKSKNKCLRALCRGYLVKLRYMARKHGLLHWVDEMIEATKNDEDCKPSEYEVEMLARACDDERVSRTDIQKILNKSYRECVDDDDFEKIKKLKRVGIYSKVSAMLKK